MRYCFVISIDQPMQGIRKIELELAPWFYGLERPWHLY